MPLTVEKEAFRDGLRSESTKKRVSGRSLENFPGEEESLSVLAVVFPEIDRGPDRILGMGGPGKGFKPKKKR